jgi:3-hexulose-6-phosphate synthase
MKCMDAGGLEARLAFEAGADWMTVCAQASGATVEGAVAEARQRGRRVMVDLIGCRHWVERARELEPLGPHMFLIHVGLDEQKALGRERLFEALEEFSRTIGVPFALAGGLGPADVPRVKPYGPRVVVVGGYICRAAEPAEAARRMKEALA